MTRDGKASWNDFLNPDLLRPRLIHASIYIASFELLKDAVVDRIRQFMSIGFDQNGPTTTSDYKDQVLRRHRDVVEASLDWLLSMNAIACRDIETYRSLRDLRNRLAHELFQLLASEGLPSDFNTKFVDLVALMTKIEVWWIKEFEIPTNPDFDGQEIDEATISPGTVIALKMLCAFALGSEEESSALLMQLRGEPTEQPGSRQ
jgi:hypothetical protein